MTTFQRLGASLLLTLLAVDTGWQATWTPNGDNVAIVIVTDCDRNHPFRSVQRFDIDPKISNGSFYRPDVPQGATCLISGYVMRNAEPLNPEKEYVAESTVFTLK